MRVVNLTAENFKRLVAVDITPDSDVVILSGANGQGKSSVLDAIWAALAGRAGAVDEPVRHGADQATVRLDLGDLVVTKTWRPDTKQPRLEVTSAEGARFPSPQKMLDDLLGRFSFDPLAFANAKASEQRDILLDLSGLRERLDEIDRGRRAAYEERTAVNREVKRAEAVLAQTPKPPAGTPDEEVDVAAVLLEQQQLKNTLDERDELIEEYQRLQARMAEVMAAGQAIDEWARATYGGVMQAREKQHELGEQVATSSETNRAVQQRRQRTRLEAELTQTRETAEALTHAIQDWDAAKDEAITEADLPAPGLGFDEDGVTLNGVPFSQASAAERLRTSVAIAMAANPHVRVIRVTDGSLLDSGNMALIEQMAREKDFQVWVERVDETGQVGIVIEDGEVRS